jgi:cell division initiation protein
MRITPLEIRQKTFEKNFRGYEKDEVHGFLLTLSQEWERIQDENKELRIKLEATEREVLKLREVEGSLYKTLKTAEDTGANVIDQARKAADLHLKESQLKADAMMHEAKSKAKDTIEESETRAKEIIVEMEERLKSLLDDYKKLESSREDLLSDLRRLGSDLLDKVERSKSHSRDFDADKHYQAVKRETKKIIHPNFQFDTKETRQEQKPEAPRNEPKAELKIESAKDIKPVIQMEPEFQSEPVLVGEAPRKVQKSFFDEIG